MQSLSDDPMKFPVILNLSLNKKLYWTYYQFKHNSKEHFNLNEMHMNFYSLLCKRLINLCVVVWAMIGRPSIACITKTGFDFIQSFNRIFEYHPEDRTLYVESELNAHFNAIHTHVISRTRSFQPTTWKSIKTRRLIIIIKHSDIEAHRSPSAFKCIHLFK